ncbi:HNH endonuclease [Malaciobacter marinus]|uniref:HNH endonuclease n=1 Tax=Malaciobacter marinus TaxID=505249 RepID=A0A347TH98_9BACT|nr:HNH endonuclease signature motif containing protein [Malaciobacter marinus]AXX85976.1 hypothetical protein AMRN_0182 [Malaciobacter marinus]PHO15924.1 HNH endonuclease [Malaciobacter marinus]
MILDTDFIIIGSIIIILLTPLYIYRKKVYNFFTRQGDFETFEENIKNYLHTYYPKIEFDYSIIQKTKMEKDAKLRQILVIEDLVSQFFDFEYELETQKCIHKDFLWSTYEQNCKPIKEKLPNDWSKRKEFTYRRDNCKCKRCGLNIELIDAQIILIRPLANGGGYNFENLITLCSDCNKILNSQIKSIKSSLIEDALLTKTTVK